MKSRSLNKVLLIGNVVRQPELRTTAKGAVFCIFHLITNRKWETNNEQREESTRHICMAWAGLAEVCCELLTKGTLVYVEGRLQVEITKDYNGTEMQKTIIVLDEMIILNQKRYDSSINENENR